MNPEMEGKFISIGSDNFLTTLIDAPLKLDFNIVTFAEWEKIKSVMLDSKTNYSSALNQQITRGRWVYTIESHGLVFNNRYVGVKIRQFDIYEPNTVRWFDLDWASPIYLQNATPKILKWIHGLYVEANKWKRMT